MRQLCKPLIIWLDRFEIESHKIQLFSSMGQFHKMFFKKYNKTSQSYKVKNNAKMSRGNVKILNENYISLH